MILTGQRTFWQSATLASLTMAVCLAAYLIPVPRGTPGRSTVNMLRRTVTMRGLSAADREAQTAGYYQELLNRASDVMVRTPAQFGGGGNENLGRPQMEELGANKVEINEHLKSFLIYRPLPNMDIRDPRFNNVRYVTNAQGFVDENYPLEHPPTTRRLVILGDSMARGLGVPPGSGWEPLLEKDLNARYTSPTVTKFELINFGVSGYRITQILDIGLEVAPTYKPDVYVVVLSWLTVAKKWGLHLAQLVEEDIDPKYDFLRQVIRDAKLQKGDTIAATEAKLARFMLPTLRWSMQTLKARAAQDGASVVVFLVPHLKGIGSYDADFGPVRPMLEKEGIPYVDALEAFDELDPAEFDVGDGLHPNPAGHKILEAALLRGIDENPVVSAIIRRGATPQTAP
jgi:lysophospholipase L1-like esterase